MRPDQLAAHTVSEHRCRRVHTSTALGIREVGAGSLTVFDARYARQPQPERAVVSARRMVRPPRLSVLGKPAVPAVPVVAGFGGYWV